MTDVSEETNEHPSAQDRVIHGQDGWAKLSAFVIPAFIAVLVAMAGQGVLAWRDIAVLNHSVAELANTYITDAATLAAIAQQAHANSIYREERERQDQRWIDKILEHERAIFGLQRDAGTRADPFTGTQGAELQRRIERLESRVYQ